MAPAMNDAGISPEMNGHRVFSSPANATFPMSALAGYCKTNHITTLAGRPGCFL